MAAAKVYTTVAFEIILGRVHLPSRVGSQTYVETLSAYAIFAKLTSSQMQAHMTGHLKDRALRYVTSCEKAVRQLAGL